MYLLFTLIQKHYLSIYFPLTHANRCDKMCHQRITFNQWASLFLEKIKWKYRITIKKTGFRGRLFLFFIFCGVSKLKEVYCIHWLLLVDWHLLVCSWHSSVKSPIFVCFIIFYKKKKEKKNVLLWQIPNSIIVVSLDLNLYKLAMTSAWPFYLHVKRLGKRLSWQCIWPWAKYLCVSLH